MQGLIKSGMSAENGARPPEPPKPPQGAPMQQQSQRSQQQRGPQQPPQQQRPQGQPEQQQGKPGNGVDMDPEKAQQQRNVLVNSMLKSLYGPMLDSASQIIERSADQPTEAIGRVTGSLLSAAYNSLKEKGRTVTPGVMVQAGMVASQAVGEMATRMGVLSAEAEPEVVESGFMMGMGRFGEMNSDKLTPEQRQRYAELIDGMEEGKRMAMGGQPPQGGQPNPRQSPADSGAPAPRETMMRGGA